MNLMSSRFSFNLIVGSGIAMLSLGAVIAQAERADAIFFHFDYIYDSNNFFNTQAKKDLLEQKVASYFTPFTDNLTAINPGPSGFGFDNTWTAKFTHPGTGLEQSIANLVVPANTLIVYAGGRDLPGNTLGMGGPGGFSASGTSTFVNTVKARGQSGALASTPTDFGGWGGAITFDTNATWNFSSASPSVGENDFLSVAIHEMAHLLGLGSAPSWDTYVSGGQFIGTNSVASYGGNVPLYSDHHWAEGTMSTVKGVTQEAAMDPTITVGTRKLMTELDYAGLADVGWETQEVPFEFSPSLGIILVSGLYGIKKATDTIKKKKVTKV
jgi:hypothetical protein